MKVATASATFKLVNSKGDEVIASFSVSPSQLKAKAGGSLILTNGDTVTATFSATSIGAVNPAPPTTPPSVLTLIASSLKMKASGKPVVLEGDESLPVPVPVITPSGSPFTDTVKVVVTAAGQSKVKAT